ncbi:dephospho-CoA kinase [Alistipes sp.]|uniref:dephospho-CoA kinase n=1 Tax=Alistipes sp. TaxID=1872444 RepID=UPI0025BB61E0|nr:dephospho-CoA kinase [Alistipes sp.]MCI7139474.1 dephospho-CoA kinase [Alistipes sp.]MDY5397463.1 dephospho-CoA kinase [Alistipes sp.]
MFKVGITGGIGSGKSTVCRLFAARGIAVYDSDSEAKRLMNSSEELRARLEARFGAETYRDGALDRVRLARIVFSDPQALSDLDRLVHPAVRADFAAWAERQQSDYVILESAILFEAGFASEVDRTVAVLAPLELRVERTCRRDGCDAESVRRRIAAQTDDDTLCARADFSLVNIIEEELGPAVETLDRRFRHEARNNR